MGAIIMKILSLSLLIATLSACSTGANGPLFQTKADRQARLEARALEEKNRKEAIARQQALALFANSAELGMTKQSVKALIGEPTTRSLAQGNEILFYDDLYNPLQIAFDTKGLLTGFRIDQDKLNEIARLRAEADARATAYESNRSAAWGQALQNVGASFQQSYSAQPAPINYQQQLAPKPTTRCQTRYYGNQAQTVCN